MRSSANLPNITTMQFRVDLAQFSGPVDLLLHIVRRDEISLASIPVSKIVDQYFLYLEVLVELEIDDVAEFLEIASLLIEWKSKQAIPNQELDGNGNSEIKPAEDLSDDIVAKLLEYKRYRDAADELADQGHRWQLRYSRRTNDLPSSRSGTDLQPIEKIEVWDLVSAFGRILRDRKPPKTTEVIYDDTPIQTYMSQIHELLLIRPRVELTSLFQPNMHKSTLIGLFMATLELTRHYGVTTDQTDSCQPLYLVAGQSFRRELDWKEKVEPSER